jgi:hypothetical protein
MTSKNKKTCISIIPKKKEQQEAKHENIQKSASQNPWLTLGTKNLVEKYDNLQHSSSDSNSKPYLK